MKLIDVKLNFTKNSNSNHLGVLSVTDKKKTSADVKKEGEILTEMLEIVSKRDSLIALLEEERQRWRKPSCPTLTIPFQSSNYPSKNTSSCISYTYISLVILVAYLISFYLTEHFLASLNGPLVFLLQH